MLVLTWIVPGGRRGTIMLDLLNCNSVGTALSPQHPQARDDIGAIAAKEQSTEPGQEGLLEMLSPFHLMYEDGTERLGTDSPRERLAWINAIRYAMSLPLAICCLDAYQGCSLGMLSIVRSLSPIVQVQGLPRGLSGRLARCEADRRGCRVPVLLRPPTFHRCTVQSSPISSRSLDPARYLAVLRLRRVVLWMTMRFRTIRIFLMLTRASSHPAG